MANLSGGVDLIRAEIFGILIKIGGQTKNSYCAKVTAKEKMRMVAAPVGVRILWAQSRPLENTLY